MHQKSIHPELDKLINTLAKEEDQRTLDIGNNTLIIEKKFRAPITDYYYNMYNERKRFKYDILPNLDFYIRFYFPRNALIRKFNGQAKDNLHLIIMFNGLDESLDVHYKLYDRLGSSLASYGIASVLMPTPFHLNRAAVNHEVLRNSKPEVKKPSASLLQNPWYLPNNFAQVIYEFNFLLKLIKCEFNDIQSDPDFKNIDIKIPTEDDNIFYNLFFKDKQLDISLLGYSLGGLKALSCFKQKPELIKTCILLNSGGALKALKLGPPMMENKIWQDEVVEYIIKRKIKNGRRREFDIFQGCKYVETIDSILTDEEKVFDDPKYDKHICKIIIVAGGKDRLVEPESIKRLESAAHGLNILQVADLGHFISDDPQFNKWYSRIINLLIDFFEDIEGESISKSANLALFATFDFLCNNELVKGFNDSKKLSEIVNIVEEKINKKNGETDFYSIIRSIFAYFKKFDNYIEVLAKYKKKNNLFFGQMATKFSKSKYEILEEIISREDSSNTSTRSGEKLYKAEEIMGHQIDTILENQMNRYQGLIKNHDAISENWKQKLSDLISTSKQFH